MTQFEYLTVAFSILIAITVSRLLEGLIYVCRSGSQYWIHTYWIIQTLFTAFATWWGLWGYSEFEWNYLLFLWVLMSPVLLFAASVALIPRVFEHISNWERFFYENSRFYFLLQAGTVLHIASIGLFIRSILPGYFWLLLPLIAIIYIGAAFVQKEKFHISVVIFSALVGLGAVIPALLQVGA